MITMNVGIFSKRLRNRYVCLWREMRQHNSLNANVHAVNTLQVRFNAQISCTCIENILILCPPILDAYKLNCCGTEKFGAKLEGFFNSI